MVNTKTVSYKFVYFCVFLCLWKIKEKASIADWAQRSVSRALGSILIVCFCLHGETRLRKWRKQESANIESIDRSNARSSLSCFLTTLCPFFLPSQARGMQRKENRKSCPPFFHRCRRKYIASWKALLYSSFIVV